MSEVIIRQLDIERDAEKLAAMWADSDLQWPNTFSRGAPITAEMIRTWAEEERLAIVFVAELDGEIVGYSSFADNAHGREGEGYLDLLNVNPRFQKRSIGRRLIQATIDYSVKRGFKRQTLHTWSANFKAVPTYKKTGHFWTPDREVWMQNFIPGALQMPLAKPFFERHNWYDSYVRDLTQEPDDQRWEGLKVYTEHWEADGEALTIWIDREARAPVAIETDRVQVAAIAADIEPVAGGKVTLRWRVINKTAEPVSVRLHAQGDKGLTIEHHTAFVVPGGETAEREAQVTVAEDAPASKDDGTAPAVRSLIYVDDQEVELFSGLRAKRALSLDTAPEQISLRPGRERTVQLQLHNERHEPLTVALWLTPPAGLDLNWTHQELSVPARGHAALPLTLLAAEEGAYSLAARIETDGGALKALNETLSVLCVGAGGLVAQRSGSSVRVETDAFRFSAGGKGGALRVESKEQRLNVASVEPFVGPPYYPSVFEGKEFEVDVRSSGPRTLVHLWCEAKYDEGLYLHQQFTFSAAGLVDLRYWLENRSGKTYTRSLRLYVQGADAERQQMALPLVEGLVHGKNAEFPATHVDAPERPDGYSEPWVAWERQGLSAGLAWDEHLAKIWNMYGMELTSVRFEVAPGQTTEVVCFALVVGRGDWHLVREAALRWLGLEPAPADAPRAQPAVLAQVEPGLMVTLDERTDAQVRVSSQAMRPSAGTVVLTGEEGLSVAPSQIEVAGLQRGHAQSFPLQITLNGGGPGVWSGQANLDADLWEINEPFHVLRLGTHDPVSVSEGALDGKRLWTIANGANEFVVSPDFGPSLIAWNREGQNQLWSAFPQPTGWSWTYPWFGGVHAKLFPAGSWVWHGLLHKERFEAGPIEVLDGRGILWRGVHLSVRPEKEQLHDFAVELDWLTVGQSPVLKLVYRLRNLRPTAQKVMVACDVAASLGSEARALTLRGEGVRHRPKPWAISLSGQRWGALVNEATGRTLVMVGAQPDISLQNGGQWGRLLGAVQELSLSGDETKELVYYFVLTERPELAERFAVLQMY